MSQQIHESDVPPSAPTAAVADERSLSRIVFVLSRAITLLAYAYLLFVEALLLLGFFLLLAGANPTSSFVEWAYRSLDRVMEPFRGMFTPIELGTTRGNEVPSIFDSSVLFAMLVYGLVAIAIHVAASWLAERIWAIDRANSGRRADRALARM